MAFAVGLIVGAIGVAVFAQQATAPARPAEAESLPPDVSAESRNRLPVVKRDDLDAKGRQLYDGVVGDARRLTGLQGPAGIRLHSPAPGDLVLRLNNYLRFESGLGARTVELAILVVARELDSQFEWQAHEPSGLRAGLSQELIDVVKRHGASTGQAERDAAVIELGREALAHRAVTSATYARALEAFGPKDLVDLTLLIGEYSSTAVLLNTFDQQLPPGQRPGLPPR
jgi:4-carboxymuconolactone decarboxylase